LATHLTQQPINQLVVTDLGYGGINHGSGWFVLMVFPLLDTL